jgi:hypothetical protein
MTNALNQLSTGDRDVATADIENASTAMDNGNTKITPSQRRTRTTTALARAADWHGWGITPARC